jgi:hypothetical protein
MLMRNTVLTSLTYVELIHTGRYLPTAHTDWVIVAYRCVFFSPARIRDSIDRFPIFLEGLELNSTLETLE